MKTEEIEKSIADRIKSEFDKHKTIEGWNIIAAKKIVATHFKPTLEVKTDLELTHGKPLEYWKQNAEEDYMKVPISVLKYITILEEVVAYQLGTQKDNWMSDDDIEKYSLEFANKFDEDCKKEGLIISSDDILFTKADFRNGMKKYRELIYPNPQTLNKNQPNK